MSEWIDIEIGNDGDKRSTENEYYIDWIEFGKWSIFTLMEWNGMKWEWNEQIATYTNYSH